MNENERNLRYNAYVESKMPKTKPWPSLFHAFWVGGLICCVGELIKDLCLYIFPYMSTQEASNWALIALIIIAAFLTAIGIFDRIGAYAGAGTIVPITGFSNSIASPALEFKREGLVFGLMAKMFIIAGPVIVTGVVASVIVGLVYLFI
ncbi:MAG: SpoVA/SpoVAEb family sporulation membrane protein [Clostridia bacterium]|nr:SpoVA/SpoVAEb family sporulation membrane protein [Clostridia bacterium]